MKTNSPLLLLWVLLFAQLQLRCNDRLPFIGDSSAAYVEINPAKDTVNFKDEHGVEHRIYFINPTFMNNPQRNYYGDTLPSRLNLIWKTFLGSGKTSLGKDSLATWSGAGWTGQPLMVWEDGKKYIIQGAYDHRLKKIDCETGKIVWQYEFDDVLKGTGTIWYNANAGRLTERCVIMQGSRASFYKQLNEAPSFRAVSYFTGTELWRLPSTRTLCYSRDVDASAIVIHDTAYMPLENGIFNVFDPAPSRATLRGQTKQPYLYRNSDTLYSPLDTVKHRRNLVTEASPAYMNGRIYLASGAGRIYGYNIRERRIDWTFFTGSDLDGSPVVTDDGCLLIPVEKEYISGNGGLLKLDPSKKPTDALVWYFPTGDKKFASWDGGIIGTPSTNERSRGNAVPPLGTFIGIDGFIYVVRLDEPDPQRSAIAFDGITKTATPKLVYKYAMGPSISSPIFVGNRIAALGYNGFYLFEHDAQLNFKLIAQYPIRGEATPFADGKRVFVASRDGYLYCFGERNKGFPIKRVKKSHRK